MYIISSVKDIENKHHAYKGKDARKGFVNP